MVKKLIRPHESSISVPPPAFPEYESIVPPRLLGSPGVSVIHCLFPEDNVPFDVAYRDGSGEREVGGLLRL